jgi:hypothetical protein
MNITLSSMPQLGRECIVSYNGVTALRPRRRGKVKEVSATPHHFKSAGFNLNDGIISISRLEIHIEAMPTRIPLQEGRSLTTFLDPSALRQR